MIELLVLYGLTALANHVENPPEPEPIVETAQEAKPHSHEPIEGHWQSLADCESGEWDARGMPIPDSARWDYGEPEGFFHEGYSQFHGGLNFHPDTWEWVAPMVGLGHINYAYQATPEEQIQVGEKVQELQGWKAWPVCSRKVGLR